MTPGELIRARRKALGWSQAKLAQTVKTNQQTIDKIEQGTIKHSRFMRGIAAALELSWDELEPIDLATMPAGMIPGKSLAGARDLPVHAAAEGSACQREGRIRPHHRWRIDVPGIRAGRHRPG